MNILIIGGGCSGRRFCESLLLFSEHKLSLCSNTEFGKTKALSEEYHLSFIPFEELKGSVYQFDVIVLAVPLGYKCSIFDRLVIEYGYRSSVIFEKPFSLDKTHIHKIQALACKYDIKYIVAYNRRYMKVSKLTDCNLVEVKFPIVNRKDALIHGLPHAVDFLMILFESDYLRVEGICTKMKQCTIKGSCRNRSFILNLYITDDKENMVEVNGEEINWPSLRVYSEMINAVALISQKQITDNYQKELKIVEIIREVKSVYEKSNVC